eukprot:m.113305 g.113305  ORF g.113305 m.113305 type:complete len:82 (+) comp28261_c0_seq3:460-705(+)
MGSLAEGTTRVLWSRVVPPSLDFDKISGEFVIKRCSGVLARRRVPDVLCDFPVLCDLCDDEDSVVCDACVCGLPQHHSCKC